MLWLKLKKKKQISIKRLWLQAHLISNNGYKRDIKYLTKILHIHIHANKMI
uniref:Uncharacterized protein n=1 Tax=Rhizophora mucronata TaxID=61149 RepID=A0A2P2NDY7_RHIMU